MKYAAFCFAFVAAALGVRAAEGPSVRYSSERPIRDGVRVETAWKNADTLERFTTVEKYDIATDQSEVQALFDAENVYLSAKGWYDGRIAHRTDEAKRNNLFEFFVQADAANVRYVQVRVRENGEFDAYEFDQGVKRQFVRAKGIAVSVSELPVENTGPHHGLCAWRANAIIPFKLLGGAAPTADRAARLGVMRTNVSLAGGHRELSSLTAILENFGLSEFWQPVTFTRSAATPRTFKGDVRDARVNYFANPEFDAPERCWQTISTGGHVDHVETMAMSGEWIYRTTGKTYRFLCGSPDSFAPNTPYTLMVRARRFGDAGNLRILTMKRLPDGRPAEGEYLGGDIALGPEFHEYYFPFATDANQPTAINFYRLGPAAEDKGVEIAAIKLFKGKVSSLEIRPISRIGLKEPVPGTALPMRPNPYGRRAEHLKVLCLVRSIFDIREYQEICAGLNVTLDVLLATGMDQDIYETDSDLKAVQKRLEENAYGLFIVGERAGPRVGAEMAKKVLASVENGAGLLFCPNAKTLHFSEVLQKANARQIPTDHTLCKAFPYGMFRPGQVNPHGLKIGQFGKGRVVLYPGARPRPRMAEEDYGAVDFPLAQFADPWVARVLYWTAGVGGTGVRAGSVPLPGGDARGKVIAARRIVDEKGYTLEYEAEVTEKTGPRVFVRSIIESVKGEAPFVFDVTVSNATQHTVRWRLEDFSGRALEAGTGTGRVEVPSKALYTNLGIFRAEIAEGGKIVDAVRVNCYARDRDAARTYDDFTASIWPMGETVPAETVRDGDQRLLDIGFRASLMPIGPKYANTLAGGLALGGGFLGSGAVFCGWPHKDNVRTRGEINTAKGRKSLAEGARNAARNSLKYGVVQHVVCDEPNLSMRFCEMEPDEQPENIAEYRARQIRKYGTLDNYNKHHQTSHASWEHVGPAHLKEARASGKYAEFIEWRAFNADRWCEAIKLLADNGKTVDPDLKLSLYNSFGQTAISGNDYWKLLTKAGLGFSNEYTAMVYFGRDAIYNFDEFYRSFRPDLRVWGFTGYSLSKEQISFMPWWFAAHRYGGFTWFATWSWLFNILDVPTCSFTGDALALKNSLRDSRLLDGLGKYTLAWNWTPRDVALYYSHESLMVSTLLGTETKSFEIAGKGPLHEYMYSRQGLQYLVEGLLYQHDFVAPEQIVAKQSNAFLSRYKILFMPRILAMSDAEVAAVKAYMANGGTVVADVLPGDYDELGVKRAVNPFLNPDGNSSVRIWGRSFNDLDLKQHAEMLVTLKDGGARPVLASEGIEKREGREAMHLTDGVGDLYFILRMTARSTDRATETFVFPKKAHTWNVRTHDYLGEVDRATTAVSPSSAAVYAQLPFKPTVPEVVLPKTVVRGTDATLNLSLDIPAAAGDAHFVYHVKFTKPDGTSPFHFARNLDARGGGAKLDFRIAANDPVGNWKVTVTEPLTGLATERAFEVKER